MKRISLSRIFALQGIALLLLVAGYVYVRVERSKAPLGGLGALSEVEGSVVEAQGSAANLSRVAGVYVASQYNNWSAKVFAGNSATGSATITLFYGTVVLPDGRVLIPFATTASLLVDYGANQETVTPTTVSGCTAYANLGTCQITATFANTHGAGTTVTSGTFGLQEAINDAKTAGGVVVVDSSFTGSTSTITSATGASNVSILDLRGTSPAFYTGATPKISLSAAPSVTVAGPTLAIAATSCSGVTSLPVTGVTTTSVLDANFATAPGTGYTAGLVVNWWPSAGNINMQVCNPTAASQTPAAQNFTVRVIQF